MKNQVLINKTKEQRQRLTDTKISYLGKICVNIIKLKKHIITHFIVNGAYTQCCSKGVSERPRTLVLSRSDELTRLHG